MATRTRTLTLKSVTDENAQLKMRVHELECELAKWREKGFWSRLVWLAGIQQTPLEGKQ